MSKNIKGSLANKVLLTFAIVFLGTNIFLFTGATLLNKSAFYELEKEKDELLIKNFAPFLAVSLFLDMNSKVKNIANQLLSNTNVAEVKIYKNKKLIYKNKKEDQHCTITIKKPIYQPNSKNIIGEIEVSYTTEHFEMFMKEYFKFLLLSAVFIILIFIAVYIYLKKLFQPIKNLSSILKDIKPSQKLNIPYIKQNDEIGLIANAIDILNKKNIDYSNELRGMAKILIDANKNLEQRVQEELQTIIEKDKQLLQQSKLAQMGEMINMIAHQWRQPLASINSTTNNLQFKLMFGEIDKEFFEQEIKLIAEYAQYLSNTIDDFRNFFKNKKDKEAITLESLVKDTLRIAQVSIENHNIEIKTIYNCKEKINTHPNELKQVILNLIKNAQDVLLEKEIKNPFIEIETSCVKDIFTIKVSDNGGGIPDEIKDKIFEPYFSTKKEKDGTGLGLYMSKTIIQKHCDGKLEVENSDNGAVFKIILYKNGGGRKDDDEQTKG